MERFEEIIEFLAEIFELTVANEEPFFHFEEADLYVIAQQVDEVYLVYNDGSSMSKLSNN